MGRFPERYHYLQFDFTEITEEGLYQVMYGDAASPVFRIAKDVWDKGIWQAEVGIFPAGTDVSHACQREVSCMV